MPLVLRRFDLLGFEDGAIAAGSRIEQDGNSALVKSGDPLDTGENFPNHDYSTA